MSIGLEASRLVRPMLAAVAAAGVLAGASTAGLAEAAAGLPSVAPAGVEGGKPALAASPEPAPQSAPESAMTMETFLDRLMAAESGGRDDDVNPRSTAAGAFQFIASTFLDLARRNFATETATLAPEAVLKLRFNRAFARKAALAYTQENADRLAAAGIAATFPRLRLAHLVGPGAAIRLLRVPPQTRAAEVLGAPALHANPFLAALTAKALIDRAARDLETSPDTAAGVPGRADRQKRGSAIALRCTLQRPACRRWLALAERHRRKAASR